MEKDFMTFMEKKFVTSIKGFLIGRIIYSFPFWQSVKTPQVSKLLK